MNRRRLLWITPLGFLLGVGALVVISSDGWPGASTVGSLLGLALAGVGVLRLRRLWRRPTQQATPPALIGTPWYWLIVATAVVVVPFADRLMPEGADYFLFGLIWPLLMIVNPLVAIFVTRHPTYLDGTGAGSSRKSPPT
jgi:hypothetical protein